MRKQKPVAPKKRPPVTSRHNNRRLAVPPPVAAKWRPKQKPFLRRPFENRPRLPPPPPVAHHPNQAQHQYMNGVGVGYNKPTVASKVVVVPPPPPPKKEENIEKSVQKVNSSNSTEKPENSLFSSSLKRISKIMSGMNMETDSGMSSPSTDHLMDHPVNLGNVKVRHFKRFVVFVITCVQVNIWAGEGLTLPIVFLLKVYFDTCGDSFWRI